MVSILGELRVCIVDSDGEMRRSIREELSILGINQVRECADLSMALLLLQDFAADLCIVDSMKGHPDGLSLVQHIRTAPDSPAPELAIIMLTENTNTQYVVDARNAGVDEFLAKPIKAKALHSRLLSIVENPRLFVRSPDYTGPDRRYQERSYVGQERRHGIAADTSQRSAVVPPSKQGVKTAS